MSTADLPRSLRRLYRQIRKAGWCWERLGSDHIMFFHSKLTGTVIASGTGRDRSREHIIRQDLRRCMERRP